MPLSAAKSRGRERTPALGVVVGPRDAPLLYREDVVYPVVELDLEHPGAARVEVCMAFGADQLERVGLTGGVAP